MINNKFWREDLSNIIKELSQYSKKEYKRYMPKAEHIINRSFLYSAIIIRKAIENEKDAKSYVEKRGDATQILKTLYHNVPVVAYDFLPDSAFRNRKCYPDYYDMENAEIIDLELVKVCNQIIHSYRWALLYESGFTGVYGALFASDKYKDKRIFLLSIENWINAIQFVIDNYCF